MFVLGLTGSIASGKSTVLHSFAELGIPGFSADAAVHALYEGEAVGPVGALFPEAIVDGAVDRGALSRVLARDPGKLAALEAVVHPLVRAKLGEFVEQKRNEGRPMVVLEVPLLFESGYDYGVDAVAVTVADETELRRRALARPGMTADKYEALLARQMAQSEKMRRAHYVIDTNGPLEETKAQVRAVAAACLTRNGA